MISDGDILDSCPPHIISPGLADKNEFQAPASGPTLTFLNLKILGSYFKDNCAAPTLFPCVIKVTATFTELSSEIVNLGILN